MKLKLQSMKNKPLVIAFLFAAAFAVASLLALLAFVTLGLKTLLEWRHGDELAALRGHR